jgi:hypothetical protein
MSLDSQQLQTTSISYSAFSKEQRQRVKEHLRTFQLKYLFIEELGWDRPKHVSLRISLGHEVFVLSPIAQKRGIAIYECGPDANGNIPDYRSRLRIDKEVTDYIYAHLIIYIDKAQTSQVWQWVPREPGGRVRTHEHHYYRGQDGESLLQKLQSIFVSLEEEEHTTREDLQRRLDKAFQAEQITKRFFEAFKIERQKFLTFIKGIPSQEHREWYTSVMLSRLMLVYFIQKKGFLDGDEEYLSNRLEKIHRQYSSDSFFSFYRTFLLRLFHEGLGNSERPIELEREFGYIPYLNGGLFEEHKLEQVYPDIQIPDEAFDSIFSFFSKWRWHLDEEDAGRDNEIHPDVLGYIFEKLANQRKTGTYYTKEDITEYMVHNTIVSFLLHATREAYPDPFRSDSSSSIWRLLHEIPDKYIHETIRKGVDKPLPEEIACGLLDVFKRENWNKPALVDYAWPRETWREVITRRRHYDDMRCNFMEGAVNAIDDFITYNLDIQTFAQDVIEQSQDIELIYHFYKAMSQLKLLDPTCGSGAFLLAALNTLKPLYEICLRRMKEFLEKHSRLNVFGKTGSVERGCKIKCVSWLSVEEFRRGKVEEETDDHSTRIDRRIAERLRRPA